MIKKIAAVMMTIIFIISLYSFSGNASAARLHHESWYQNNWCVEGIGETEVVLSDRTRVDCLTEVTAIEFDFADKWAEAVGQSIHYANMTGKRASIGLIMEKPTDVRYFKRLQSVISGACLDITLFCVGDRDICLTIR